MEKAAAIFIDYENVYYYLKNKYKDPPELSSYTSDIIRSLRREIEKGYGLQSIIMNAYADFEQIGSSSLSTLYLMGIHAQNVLGTAHKNAADMQMCIDLMQILYTRPDIQNFVLLAGDRDYIPVVQHLKRNGRQVWVCAFRDTISGDLLEIIGEKSFLDIGPLLSQEALEKMEMHREMEEAKQPFRPNVVGRIDLEKIQKTERKATATIRHRPIVPRPSASLGQEDYCLALILNYIEETKYKEPGVTPLLRFLTDEMPLLANWERKELLSRLEGKGAIHIETREGFDFPFAVVIVNPEHPSVKELKV